MFKFLKKLWRDRRGNALVIAGAALPMVVGAAGLATDTIQWTLWKRQLQRAADSAAIAGVYERESANGATTTVDSTVSHDLTLNLHTFYGLKTGNPNCSGKCTLVFPADSGVETDQVTVTIAIQQRLPFSSFFLHTPPTITATATAASIPAGGDACIEALDTTSTTGVTFSGNAAVEMPDCDIFSNTSGTNSAIGRGSAAVTANSVGGVGGIQQSNNFTVNAYRPYSPALNDPYANVNPDPADMHCTSSALTPNTDFGSLASGTNCFSSLSVGPNQTLNIPASYSGPIYINGGGVDFKGTFNCSSCTIVLTNSSGSSTATIGQLTTNATANVNITAPTTGTYKGIAIMQDRRSTTCTGNCNTINGNSASVITGAVYFPNQEVWYNGTGTTTATCTMFVAKRITFTGNSGTSNKFKSLADCSSEGLPSNASVRMVRLVG
ncbi:MAG TPA: Tad domain-containing protein [Sphingomicrobium sp.]|nr:Tad domain-containing protein [Sphingomicrobium sp.]